MDCEYSHQGKYVLLYMYIEYNEYNTISNKYIQYERRRQNEDMEIREVDH